MDLSLRQVRAYLAVARTLSFTRAAAETNLSQPALTVQIRTLEQQLGIKLFDRSSRSVALTRLGRELVPVFQRILREFDETVMGVRDIARHGGGSVRLGALPSFAAGILPDVIVRFRSARRTDHQGCDRQTRDGPRAFRGGGPWRDWRRA